MNEMIRTRFFGNECRKFLLVCQEKSLHNMWRVSLFYDGKCRGELTDIRFHLVGNKAAPRSASYAFYDGRKVGKAI